jgi:glycosyltransferase involved in cell wall biosynthesis
VKVLFAASTFPRWPGDPLPDFVWRQIAWLRRARPELRACVLAPHDAGAPTREHRDGIEIRRVRYARPDALEQLVYPAIWPNIRAAPWRIALVPLLLAAEFIAALRWMREERFDLVYSHWFIPQGIACGLAALLTGTPHSYTSHSSDVAVMRRVPLIGAWLVRFITGRARAVTAVSDRSRDAIRSYFSATEWQRVESRVAVIPMGVELEEWREMPVPSDAGSLLFLGRLAEKKGVDVLLRALDMTPLKESQATLTVAGDGPPLAALRELAGTLGLSQRVNFVGYVAGADKMNAMRSASIVVIPSIVTEDGDREGMPVTLLEALAAGRIVVATDVSGAPDVVRDGETGFIVPQRDPAAMARAIAEALALPADARAAMSARARAEAQRFDWSVVAEAHARHLLDAA